MAVVAREAGFRVAGFVDNLDRSRCRGDLAGLPVHWVDELASLAATHQAICGLGTTQREALVAQAEAAGMAFATVVHPAAVVSPTAVVEPGCYVSPRSVVGPGARLSRHAIVLQGALVGARAEIGPCSSILAGANVGRDCLLGRCVYVGAGAVVVDGVQVGSGSVVGAGAAVTATVPAHSLVVGVPARIVKEEIAPR